MRLTASSDDFLKGELISVGFHPAVIVAATEKTSKRKTDSPPDWSPSQFMEVQFKITAGPDKGKLIYTNFSEKAATFIVPLLEAISGTTIDKNKPFNADINEAQLKGKRCDIMVVRGEYKNKPKSEIDGYRPYSGPAEYSFAS